MYRMVTAIVLCLVLNACVTGVAKPQNTEQRVYALEADFRVALIAAAAYDNLPECGTNPIPCSDSKTVIGIAVAAHQARDAIASAQELANSGLTGSDAAIRAAQLAIQALKEIAR